MPDLIIRLFEWMDTSRAAGILFGWLLAGIVVGSLFGQYIGRGRRGVKGLDGQTYRSPR